MYCHFRNIEGFLVFNTFVPTSLLFRKGTGKNGIIQQTPKPKVANAHIRNSQASKNLWYSFNI